LFQLLLKREFLLGFGSDLLDAGDELVQVVISEVGDLDLVTVESGLSDDLADLTPVFLIHGL